MIYIKLIVHNNNDWLIFETHEIETKLIKVNSYVVWKESKRKKKS